MIYNYIHIDKNSQLPIWKQILTGIESFCRVSPPETPIPTERELAHNLQVSRTTLRQALKEACAEGIIVIRWAKGIYVADKKDRKRILILMPEANDISCPWNYIMPGIIQRTDELSIGTEIILTSFLRAQGTAQIKKFLSEERFSGILHLDYRSWHDAEELIALRQLHTPLLFPHVFPEWSRTEPFPMSGINVREALRDAIRTLVTLGHRSILTLAPCPSIEHLRGYRVEEYREMLESQGADSSPELILKIDTYNDPLLAVKLKQRIAEGLPFTAILCFSDFFAIEAMKILREMDIRIPEEVSIMGFCGYPGGKFLNPGLSTIDFHYHDIGRAAVDRLLTIPADWQNMPDSDRLQFSPYDITLRHSIRKISSNKGGRF